MTGKSQKNLEFSGQRKNRKHKNSFYKNEDGAKAQEHSITYNPTAKAVDNR